MKAYETPLEELPCIHPAPAIVVGIADDKARKNKEEIYCDMCMVQRTDDAATGIIGDLSKGESLEDMVEKYENGRHTAQAIE